MCIHRSIVLSLILKRAVRRGPTDFASGAQTAAKSAVYCTRRGLRVAGQAGAGYRRHCNNSVAVKGEWPVSIVKPGENVL